MPFANSEYRNTKEPSPAAALLQNPAGGRVMLSAGVTTSNVGELRLILGKIARSSREDGGLCTR